MTRKDFYKLLLAGGTGFLTAFGSLGVHRYATGFLLRRGMDEASAMAMGAFCVIIFLSAYLWGAVACYLAYKVRDMKDK